MKWSLLWRNAELRQLFFSWLCVTLLAASFSFYLLKAAGFLLLATSAALGLLTLFFTRKRYRALADLSLLLDRILHGEEILTIEDHEEGELSLLKSELSKMTLRLRDQADNLKQDKALLGESIADISHQLRTPLTSLQLVCSFLHQEDLSEERHLELLREASALLTDGLVDHSAVEIFTSGHRCRCVSGKIGGGDRTVAQRSGTLGDSNGTAGTKFSNYR